MLLVILAIGAGVESVPGVPGHDGAALSAELLGSDAGNVGSKISPFGGHPHGPCSEIESRYGVGNDLLKENQIGFYASAWPTYQALDAFYLTSLSGHDARCSRDLYRTLEAVDANYWSHGVSGMPAAFDQGPAAMHLPSDLPRVDDSLWLGITLIGAYKGTKNQAFLKRAEGVFALGRANWDPRKGGIYWEDHGPGATDYEKAVVSNAPEAVIGVELYRLTGRRNYLDWAERILSWLRAHLLDRSDGLYNDHLDDHRSPTTVDHAQYTYDQGIVVGLLVLLSRVAPGSYPLTDAVSLGRRAMNYFRAHHSYGNPSFDAVWARNLLWAAGLYQEPSFTSQARRSVKAAIKAEPKHPGGLLEVSSEIALRDLSKLPPGDYAHLGP